VSYRIVIADRAEKELDALDRQIRARISTAILRLAVNPYQAANVKSLGSGLHRLRVGDYRVIYEVKDDILVILVVRVGHRREVYRR
jgi:mRNA interferase RelE/StbE